MKDIKFAGQEFVLDPSGLLIWPAEETAVVADLHLEKASFFAAYGQMLPPHDSFETLQKLISALEFTNTKKLILLGDSFHDEKGFHRLSQDCQNLFEKLCDNYEVIWITGYHDGAFVAPNTKAYDEIKIDDIVFRHEAINSAKNEISGHFHPKATLRLRGKKVSRPCFIHDKNRIILPAFGVFTGGLDISSEKISDLFPQKSTAYILGKQSIYEIPNFSQHDDN